MVSIQPLFAYHVYERLAIADVLALGEIRPDQMRESGNHALKEKPKKEWNERFLIEIGRSTNTEDGNRAIRVSKLVRPHFFLTCLV